MIAYPNDCLSLLRAMSGEPWDDAQRQRYAIALNRLVPALGRAVVQEIALEKWRPAPADILRAAARRLSPCPDADDAYGEALYKAHTIGRYCQPLSGPIQGREDPGTGNCYVEGAPPFSHPLINRALFAIGGWAAFCSGESGELGTALKAQFRDAYKCRAAEWVEEVVEQLSLPEERRDPRYFQPYRPFIQTVEVAELEAPSYRAIEAAPPSGTPMPAEVGRHYRRLQASVAMPEPAKPACRPGLTREQRAAAEAEVHNRRYQGD